MMTDKEFAIVQAIIRAAFNAAASLDCNGEEGSRKGILRHQVGRLYSELKHTGDERAEKVGTVLDWWDRGALPDNTRVVLSV